MAICWFVLMTTTRIIKTFGDTTQYLLQKNFNLNLAELLPERLSVAFYYSKPKALGQSNEKVALSGIKFKKINEN